MKNSPKFICVFLALAMIFSMVPFATAANGEVAYVADKNGYKIGTFATLPDAISVAEINQESVITLIDDVVIEKRQKIKSGKFTLDLNGKTITNEDVAGDGFVIDSEVELTVVDSGLTGEIVAANFGFLNDGTLIIKGGRISTSYGIYSYGKVVIDGGVIQGSITNNGSLIVNGGTLTKIKNPNTSHVSNVEINGGTFTSPDTFENSDGEITVKGGIYPNGFSINNDGILNFSAKSVLADGYYFFDKNGDVAEVTDNTTKIDGYVKVTNGAEITLSQTSFVYCGKECKPDVTVKLFGDTLTENEDYILVYTNNIKAGTATVSVKAVEGSKLKGESSTNFIITKKLVTAKAVVQDKVYDGNNLIDSSLISITFDGIVDGDDFEVTKCVGMFLSPNAGNNKTLNIAYYAGGEDADNYDILEDSISIPEKENYYIITKANIVSKDISDALIVLGDALIYNGTEQTQTIAGVTVDGLSVTYDATGTTATNVGIYKITITGKGNFTGSKTMLYEIAPNTVLIDNLSVDNVKSDDKESIEAVKESVENAQTDLADDAKKAEYKAIADKCDELLKKIVETSTTIEDVEAILETFDEEKVTVFDEKAISSVIAKINSLLEDDNLSEYEIEKLNGYKLQANKLIEIIHNPVEYFSVRFLYLFREAFSILWRNLFGINYDV